jgi:hypothetical protein
MLIYFLSSLTATVLAMQVPQTTPQKPDQKDTKPPIVSPTASPTTSPTTSPITLSGCISPDATTPGAYTFSDAKTGVKYRLSGVAVAKEPGQRGEIALGSGSARVTIRGGLVPSANVAAQAGAIDSSKLAIASVPGGANSGTGNVQLPQFQATLVKASKGSCP